MYGNTKCADLCKSDMIIFSLGVCITFGKWILQMEFKASKKEKNRHVCLTALSAILWLSLK